MRRFACISGITLLCLWFGVIVPGHRRGIVPLPGYEAADSCCSSPPTEQSDSRPSCCPTDDEASPASSPDDRPDDPVKRCAICYIVAMLNVPPAIDFVDPPSALLQYLPALKNTTFFTVASLLRFHGRAPPLNLL
jgi:hypothetical protein